MSSSFNMTDWPEWSTERESIEPQQTNETADDCVTTYTKPLHTHAHAHTHTHTHTRTHAHTHAHTHTHTQSYINYPRFTQHESIEQTNETADDHMTTYTKPLQWLHTCKVHLRHLCSSISSTVSFLQCFETVRWVAGRTYSPYSPMSFVPKGSVSKQVEKKKAERLELSAFFQLLQKDSTLSSQWKSTMIMTQKKLHQN